jgi:hypothetical protein
MRTSPQPVHFYLSIAPPLGHRHCIRLGRPACHLPPMGSYSNNTVRTASYLLSIITDHPSSVSTSKYCHGNAVKHIARRQRRLPQTDHPNQPTLGNLSCARPQRHPSCFPPLFKNNFSKSQTKVAARNELTKRYRYDAAETLSSLPCQIHETRTSGKERISDQIRTATETQLVCISQSTILMEFATDAAICNTAVTRINGIALILVIVMMTPRQSAS